MENKSNQMISIMGFNISRFSDDTLFVERNAGGCEGEGMEVDEETFSEHINVFYQENF